MGKDEQKSGWRYYVGWPAYIIGAFLVMFSAVPPPKFPWQYLLAGIVLALAGLALVFIKLLQDRSPVLSRISRILEYLGVFILVPGVLGFAVAGNSAGLLRGFGIAAAAGVVLLLIGAALKAIFKPAPKP